MQSCGRCQWQGDWGLYSVKSAGEVCGVRLNWWAPERGGGLGRAGVKERSGWAWEVLGEEGESEQQDSVMGGYQQGALRAVELVGHCARLSG